MAVLQLVSLALAGVSCAGALPASGAKPETRPVVRRQVLASYARLPLSFEPNLGQSAAPVRFLSRGPGYGLFLTADRAILLVSRQPAGPTAAPRFHSLSFSLLGGNPGAQIAASLPLPGISNYLLGDNPRDWRTNVPHFARVRYRGVYPGIDLIYYGRQRQLEYDFVVAPGADPARICLQVRGAQKLSLDRQGNLLLQLPGGTLQLRRPQVYQRFGSRKQTVPARFVLSDNKNVSFALGGYDRSRALVIDPQLAFFTYLGGAGNETAPAVAVDSAFHAYVAGTTNSAAFPTLNPYQSTLKGTTNVFISKFNIAGTALFYSTYLGGSGTDTAAGISVDSALNAYIGGTTTSADFPITSASAVPDSPATAGTNHVFVTELNSSGTGLVYSTYLAGNGVDVASGIAVGPQPSTVFVTGTTTSSNFATVSKRAGLGTSQFFVTKLNTSKQKAASLLYSTYIGGSSPAGALTVGGGIAVDGSANAYITGGTNYTDMPAVNAYQAALKGTQNAFVAKLNPNGTLPAVFLTYLGGTGTDTGHGVAADSAGNAYVTGSTTSSDFPVLASAGSSIYQGSFAGTTDGFITKVAAAGTSLIWSTFIGASGNTAGAAIAVDPYQNTFVTGATDGSVNAVNSTQGSNAGGTDAFVGEFNVSGTAQFVTYLGGTGNDSGTGIALDTNGNPYVAGDTTSTGLATAGAYQAALSGGSDAFLAHFAGVSTLSMQATVSPNPVGIGNPATFTFTITNTGPDIATAVAFTDSLPSNGTFQNATASQGACAARVGLSFTCNLGQLPVNATATVSVRIAGTTAGTLSDSATVSSSSTTGSSSAAASTAVNDFAIAISPHTASTPAGQAATYTVTISPIPQGAVFPNGVSLKCSGGLPTATTCDFSTNPVVPGATPVTSSMVFTTTALPPGIPNAFLFRPNLRRMYAIMLPLGGVAFLGFSLGGDGRRRKRLAAFLLLGLVLALMALQPACSSSKSKTILPPFTPVGTYNVNVAAVSGTVTHTTKVVLIVQ